MSGFLYMLIEREMLRLDEDTVKIGRTSIGPKQRFAQYPKGSLMIASAKVDNCIDAEKQLIEKFDTHFTQMPDYGREYYNGDIDRMQMAFHTLILSLLDNKEKSSDNEVFSEEVEADEVFSEEVEADEVFSEEVEDLPIIELTEETVTTTTVVKRRGNKFMCKKCGKRFKSQDGYDNHVKNVKCDKNYPCTKCGKKFNNQAHLDRHYSRKTPCLKADDAIIQTDYHCECGKSFANNWNLSRHRKKCNKKSKQTVTIFMLQEQLEAMSRQIDRKLEAQKITI